MNQAILTVEQAQETLLAHLSPKKQTEKISLHIASWRVLAEDVVSQTESPPANLSMMDGYALALDTNAAAGTEFSITQRIVAGTIPSEPLLPNQAARIFTGAMLPEGATTVVMQESTQVIDKRIKLLSSVPTKQHIRFKGEEIQSGHVLLKAGTRLSPSAIGLCASVGIAQLTAYRTITVALLVTGSELIEPGNPPELGKVYNANLYLMEALLRAHGFNVVSLGVVKDNLEETVSRLKDAAAFDAIITTGGVSVGEEDYVRRAVEQLGKISTWRVRMKPGKPFTFGHVLDTPFMGLPGNPVAAYTTFHLFALPALRRLQGLPDMEIQPEPVTAEFDYSSGDRREYLRAKLVTQLGQRVAQIYPNQGSAVLASTVWADGFVLAQENTQIKPGDRVAFIPFKQFRQ